MMGGPHADIIVRAGSEIRCQRCSYFCGETAERLRFVGIVKLHELRSLIPPPRQTWRCPHCGWHNIYEPLTDGAGTV